MKVFQYFGLQNKALSPRLEKTKGFEVSNEHCQMFLDNLSPVFRNTLLNRAFGIEIEVEEVSRKLLFIHWTHGNDGSLRNNGAEFITKFGCRLYHLDPIFDEFIQTVVRERTRNKKAFDFSERCSVHVHIDVRDLNEEQLANVLTLYLLFEKAFYQLIGEDRYHNIFCVPLLETLPDTSLNIFETVKVSKKYSALNLACVADKGTVEFRAMEGNMDPQRIFPWLYILAALVTYAKLSDRQELMQRIAELKTTSLYRNFAEDIFHNLIRFLVIDEAIIDQAATDIKLFVKDM